MQVFVCPRKKHQRFFSVAVVNNTVFANAEKWQAVCVSLAGSCVVCLFQAYKVICKESPVRTAAIRCGSMICSTMATAWTTSARGWTAPTILYLSLCADAKVSREHS